jgi:hypothetical protein
VKQSGKMGATLLLLLFLSPAYASALITVIAGVGYLSEAAGGTITFASTITATQIQVDAIRNLRIFTGLYMDGPTLTVGFGNPAAATTITVTEVGHTTIRYTVTGGAPGVSTLSKIYLPATSDTPTVTGGSSTWAGNICTITVNNYPANLVIQYAYSSGGVVPGNNPPPPAIQEPTPLDWVRGVVSDNLLLLTGVLILTVLINQPKKQIRRRKGKR